MKIQSKIYQHILGIHIFPPFEFGVVLGEKQGIICSVYFDIGEADGRSNYYSPDINAINCVIECWSRKEIRFCGIAHSHPNNQNTLSGDDIKYIKAIMETMPEEINYLYFPIVFPTNKILSYKAERNENAILIANDDVQII